MMMMMAEELIISFRRFVKLQRRNEIGFAVMGGFKLAVIEEQ
jgi:hypothetical protein